MNNALAMLALGQMQSAKESTKLATYSIELPNGEVVTIGDLTNFWIEGHQKIKKALEIIKENREKVEKEDKTTQLKSANEKKAESKQRVERKKTAGKRKSKDRPCDS